MSDDVDGEELGAGDRAIPVVGDEREHAVLVRDELSLVPLIGPQQDTQGEGHRHRFADRAPYGG